MFQNIFELSNSIFIESNKLDIYLSDNKKYKDDPVVVGFVNHVRNKIRNEYEYINGCSILDYVLPILVFTGIGIPFYFCYKIYKLTQIQKKQESALQKIQIALAEYSKILNNANYVITFEKVTTVYKTTMAGYTYWFKIQARGEDPLVIPGINDPSVNFYIQKMVDRFESFKSKLSNVQIQGVPVIQGNQGNPTNINLVDINNQNNVVAVQNPAPVA